MGIALALPTVLLCAVLFLWPLILAGQVSLFDYNGYGPLDDFVGAENYGRAVTDSDLWTALLRNVFLAIVNVGGSLGLGLVLAYGLFKRVRGWRVLQIALFVPFVLPVAVVALIWKFVYEPNQGLLNSLIANIGLADSGPMWLSDRMLALPAVSLVWMWQHVPFAMVILLAAMVRIPPELTDAAKIDGASEMQTLRNIIWPIIRPTAWLLGAIIVLRVSRAFDVIYIMTAGGPVNSTTTATLYLYKHAFEFGNYGYASALGILIAILIGGIIPVAVYRMGRTRVEL